MAWPEQDDLFSFAAAWHRKIRERLAKGEARPSEAAREAVAELVEEHQRTHTGSPVPAALGLASQEVQRG